MSVDLSAGFVGLDFPSVNSTRSNGSAPPDTIVAAGPNHIVELVNTEIAYYSKATGSKLFQQDLLDFFAPAQPGSTFLTDPVVSFDEQLGTDGRFVVGVLEITDPLFFSDSYLLYAVSDSSDPTIDTNGDGNTFSEMHRFQVQTSGGLFGSFLDYPRFGWNADAHAFTGNMFSYNFLFGTFDFTGVQVIGIDKSKVADADPSTWTAPTRLLGSTLHGTLAPATMHGSNPGDPLWMVEEAATDVTNRSQLRVLKFANVLNGSAPVDQYVVNVASYRADPIEGTPHATQPGSGEIMTNDGRILNAEWRNNRLVAAQTVGLTTDAEAHARWYELSTAGGVPSLVSQETLDPGPGIHTYFPGVAIAPNGDVGMTFMQSSTSTADANGDGLADGFMSMYVTGRTAAETTMQPPVLAKAGEATYTGLIGAETSPFRSGDYSGISVDPVDGSFWGANEYSGAFDPQPAANWATWIAHFSLTGSPPQNQPPTADITSPANNATVSGTIQMTASASDIDGSVTQVQFFVDGNSIGVDTNGADGWSVPWNTTSVADGSHTLTAVATDDLGATGNSSPVTAIVDNVAGNPNDMYVWDITFTSRQRGNKHDERIAVVVRRDSDADGVAESTDAIVAGASVTVVLTGPAGGTFTGTTDSSGLFRTGWIMNVRNGTYTAEVTGLNHATFTWNRNLDPTGNDTDVDGDNFPDQQHVIPHPAGSSSRNELVRSPLASFIARLHDTFSTAPTALSNRLQQSIAAGETDPSSPEVASMLRSLQAAQDAFFTLLQQNRSRKGAPPATSTDPFLFAALDDGLLTDLAQRVF